MIEKKKKKEKEKEKNMDFQMVNGLAMWTNLACKIKVVISMEQQQTQWKYYFQISLMMKALLLLLVLIQMVHQFSYYIHEHNTHVFFGNLFRKIFMKYSPCSF